MTETITTLTELYARKKEYDTVLELIEKNGLQSTTYSGADFYAKLLVLRDKLQNQISQLVAEKL